MAVGLQAEVRSVAVNAAVCSWRARGVPQYPQLLNVRARMPGVVWASCLLDAQQAVMASVFGGCWACPQVWLSLVLAGGSSQPGSGYRSHRQHSLCLGLCSSAVPMATSPAPQAFPGLPGLFCKAHCSSKELLSKGGVANSMAECWEAGLGIVCWLHSCSPGCSGGDSGWMCGWKADGRQQNSFEVDSCESVWC